MRLLITHLAFALVVSLLLLTTHNPDVSDLFVDLMGWYGFQLSAFVFSVVFEVCYQAHIFFFPPRVSEVEMVA